MNAPSILIAQPQTTEQMEALRAFMQALKIKFEVKDESSYDPDFVQKIEESREQISKKQVRTIAKKDLKTLLDL
jgi:uncharacterized membrane protein (DUF106 family)